MGRRLLFLLVMTLLVVSGPSRVLGQQGERPVSEETEPGVLPFPVGEAPAMPGPLDDEPLDVAEPQPLPGMELSESPALDAKPLRDDAVQRTQAAPAAAAPAAATPAPEQAAPPVGSVGGAAPRLDHLLMGKHEVLLSVEVQAPENMNINKEATVKIIVKNSGSADAFGVVVRDELPPGLDFVSSTPSPQQDTGSLRTWNLTTLQAGTDKIILVKVKPTQAAPLDHAVTVSFEAGSKARTRVLQPKLKVELVQTPSITKVLKGQQAEFRIAVSNTGDGPARDVLVLAKLSAGLQHDSGEKNENNSFDLPIKELGPGQREELPAMVVDAKQGGPQFCLVKVTSPDVVFDETEAEIKKGLEVVEPTLKLALTAPDTRFTDTIANYMVTVENTGTAPAKNVRVMATVPVSGRLMAIPPNAKYDAASRRIVWTLPQIDPKSEATEKSQTYMHTYTFDVRMGGIGYYEVTAEAKADGGIAERDKRSTDVKGMADVDLVVRERRRVVDVDGTTTFQVRLQNYGSKEATNVSLRAEVSPNLQIIETGGGPEQNGQGPKDGSKVIFPNIDRIPAGKEMLLGIKVKVINHENRIGTCRVFVKHDELPQEIDDMATVKLTEGRRTAAAQDPTAK